MKPLQYIGLALIFIAGGYTQFATFEGTGWKTWLVTAALLVGMLMVISDYFIGKKDRKD